MEQNDGLYPTTYDSSYGPSSPYPNTPRRNRYTHASTMSWNSKEFRSLSGMPPPPAISPRALSSASRPLPLPSQSRATSDFQPAYGEVDATPRPFTMSQPSEHPEDRDWEEEAMTIGPSEAYSFVDDAVPLEDQAAREGEPYARQVISLDDPDAPVPPAVELEPGPSSKPTGRAKDFVGGFAVSLRRFPKVIKNTFYDRAATRKGAPGTAHSTGESHFVPAPAYDEPGATVDTSHASFGEAVDISAAQKAPTELSFAGEPSRRTSLPTSARRASSQVQSPSIAPDTPRFMPAGVMLAHPEFASDYKEMEMPPGPPDDSFSAHITRVANFFHELKNLPWMSDRVALDYRPTQSNRARVGKAKVSQSWYTPKHQDIDLLGGPVSPRETTVQLRSDGAPSSPTSTGSASRSVSRARLHPQQQQQQAIHTPLSFVSSPAVIPSPGASSHGQCHHAVTCSYYFSTPQPLYVYPSPMTSPLHPVSEGSTSPSNSPHPQALPVYMIPGPPPGLLPPPPPTVQRNHVRATSPTPGVPPTQRSSHSRHSGSNAH